MAKRKNKQDNIILLVLVGILFVCFIAICLLFYKYFYAGTSETKYGDRLEEVVNHKLSATLKEDINSVFADNKSVGEVTVNVQGLIIYINIDFVESVKVTDAQSVAIKALDKIGEDNLSFYEVQFLLTCADNENFPVLGSKNANSLKVVW
jgi:hypothetical protein